MVGVCRKSYKTGIFFTTEATESTEEEKGFGAGRGGVPQTARLTAGIADIELG